MKRSNGIGTFIGLIFMVFLFIARPGCDTPNNRAVLQDYYPPRNGDSTGRPIDLVDQNRQPGQQQQAGTISTVPSTIIMGSFNIQDFGPTKAGRPYVMEVLVDIVRRYDLLAIQEVSNANQTVVDQLIRQVNSDGSRYSYIIGPRQGTNGHNEQYAYIYDTAKFRTTNRAYVAPNPGDIMQRPPLVASFECTQAPAGQGFSFTVLNLHISPTTNIRDREFAALESVLPAVAAKHQGEDDFIVLGDFNDSEKGIRKYRWLPNQLSLVRSSWATKVRSGRSIDNIVIDSFNSNEFRNQSGVLNVAHEYQLAESETLKVSDHYPVWAVFSTQETANRQASRPQAGPNQPR